MLSKSGVLAILFAAVLCLLIEIVRWLVECYEVDEDVCSTSSPHFVLHLYWAVFACTFLMLLYFAFVIFFGGHEATKLQLGLLINELKLLIDKHKSVKHLLKLKEKEYKLYRGLEDQIARGLANRRRQLVRINKLRRRLKEYEAGDMKWPEDPMLQLFPILRPDICAAWCLYYMNATRAFLLELDVLPEWLLPHLYNVCQLNR